MNKHERDVRKKLAQNLGDMAEGIIKREPAFDEIPLQVEAASYLFRKYLEYFDEIDLSFKKSVLSMLIDEARYFIQEHAHVGGKSSFAERYPQHMETSDQFAGWIKNKEDPKEAGNLKDVERPKIKVSMVIKRVMKERLNDFRLDKSIKVPGLITFSKPILTDNKVFIMADRGTWRPTIDFMIGVQWPQSYFDIAEFFAGVQSHYRYNSEEELVASVNKALDLVESLLPRFVDNVQKALSQ